MELMIFYREKCPYCQECFHYLSELRLLEPYKNIKVKYINEVKEAEFANKFDYFFVPAIYLNDKKLHEGKVEYYGLKKILDNVLTKN